MDVRFSEFINEFVKIIIYRSIINVDFPLSVVKREINNETKYNNNNINYDNNNDDNNRYYYRYH